MMTRIAGIFTGTSTCREMLPDPVYYRDCIYQSLQELLDADPADKKELSL